MKLTWNIHRGLIAKIKRKHSGKQKDEQLPEIGYTCCYCEVLPVAFAEDKYVLSTMHWYWSKLSAISAEMMLADEPNGTFLVRRSSTVGYTFTMTYKIQGKVGNLRVQCQNGIFCLSFLDPLQPREPTLQRLIEELIAISIKGSFVCELKRKMNDTMISVPLKLDKPFRREVTLQDHCRRVVMRNIKSPESVSELNLTGNMKSFLLELKDED